MTRTGEACQYNSFISISIDSRCRMSKYLNIFAAQNKHILGPMVAIKYFIGGEWREGPSQGQRRVLSKCHISRRSRWFELCDNEIVSVETRERGRTVPSVVSHSVLGQHTPIISPVWHITTGITFPASTNWPLPWSTGPGSSVSGGSRPGCWSVGVRWIIYLERRSNELITA